MRRLPSLALRVGLLALLVAQTRTHAAGHGPFGVDSVYEQDVAFALDELEKRCGHFFEVKGVDWPGVRRDFGKVARGVESDDEHYVLLWRLLARLKDGHARVDKLAAGKHVQDPERWSNTTGIGMFWCRSGKKVLIKSCWNVAEKLGLEPGMEVVKVDGVPVERWIDAELERLRDEWSFSTDQHALGFLFTRGLWRPAETRMEVELKTVQGKKKSRTLTYKHSTSAPWGPAFWPPDLEQEEGGPAWGRTPEGFGYIHVRRVPSDLPERLDPILGELASVPGMILDFRANGGGGCDHDALFGRFVPRGRELPRSGAGPIASAGPAPYGGPIVVIVDSNVVSAGETASGMLKEDGRAYTIGDGPTAGMSSQKESIELPSGLFALYVSVHSNKARFNGGRGIEGIGIHPHEIVEYRAKDLAEGVDSVTQRAVELLRDFPQQQVPYDPADYGWE